MDLKDRIDELANRVKNHSTLLETEEATKNAIIMPFIQALGYDVFNPNEVIPEFTTDHGTKKGEKVDYAVKKDDRVVMLFECKKWDSELSINQANQLFRYFSVTDARFGVLTNGRVYQFFSDLDRPNKMDDKPFFTFDILQYDQHEVSELKKFSKTVFNLDNILTTANDLKYSNEVKRVLDIEFSNPSEAFIRFFTQQIYSGRLTQAVLAQFRGIVRKACGQYINEKVNEKIANALNSEDGDKLEVTGTSGQSQSLSTDDGIETTPEEIEAYTIVKVILLQEVDSTRVIMRDKKYYCGVLLDDTNRKPICKFYFNGNDKYVGFYSNKVETKVLITSLNDIFDHGDKIKAVVREYENKYSECLSESV